MDTRRAWKTTGLVVAAAGVASLLPVGDEPIAARARHCVVLLSIGALFFLQARADRLSKWLAVLGVPLAVLLLLGQHRPAPSSLEGVAIAILGVLTVVAGRVLGPGPRTPDVRTVYAMGGALTVSGVLMAIWFARP